ncbi:ABC transporter permease [Reinekea blandensis]|uniref:Putative ABC transporter, permease protein n=1 Tax=Reinekea blandensis MED297 TaxID=314283 RepID=A4BKL4_9GAMM|nr:FtsX-like permease family protein [Reinekea blandensis]EAR07325.1 putative ABC transporter, permease protein [Reinekea sp. MED297] [Reinekea blandensis MED297]
MGLTWKLALRNILRNKRRTTLTLLLISMTLAILIFTDGYMRAMSDVMVRSATRLYPGDGQIHHVDYLAERDGEKVISDVDGHLQRLQSTEQIASYSPRAMDFAMVSSSANNLAVQLVGIDPQLEAGVSKLESSLVQGEYLSSQGRSQQIMIGRPLAELLEVDLGDRLVVSVNNYEIDSVDQRLFRVSGIFQLNSKFYDEALIFVPLASAQEMMGIGSNVHEIAFNFVDESLSSDESLALWSELSGPQTIAEGWTTLMPDLATMIGLMDYSMLIVATILFVVAILGVINAMFMSIYERTYEFGVVLAIGTRRSSLFVLIMAEGLMLALISLVLGSILGAIAVEITGAVGIDYGNMDISGVALAEVLRPEITIGQFTELPFSVFVMTMVASLYPALHAARIVPAQALHKSL